MNINYIAPINPLGYGVAGSNILQGLTDLDVNVSLWPIGNVSVNEHHVEAINQALANRTDYDVDAPSVRIWHQFDLSLHVGKSLHIGFPIFELDEFKHTERQEMLKNDLILVCSKWAADIVQNQTGCDTHVVPLGVDRNIFHEKLSVANNQWTTFLHVGKWEYRKGHDILCEAFNKAFTPKDKVRLWLVPDNPFLSTSQTKEWIRLHKESEMGDYIHVIDRVRSHQELANLMSVSDCGVFPARAEGWNLELLEMMSVGKPVITTAYSGHTEYCNENNAMLIPITKMEKAYDGIFFDGTHGQWAHIGKTEVDMLVDYMRYIHKTKPYNPHGITTAEKFSWTNSAQQLIDGIYKTSPW